MSRPNMEDFARRVLDAMPQGMMGTDSDFRQNLRAALSGVLSRMDLVTREEFDIQAKVLARTRQKLEALERRISELETTRDASPGS